MRRLQYLVSSLVLGLTACGGGGGGDSPSSTPANTFPPQTPLTYTGVTTTATLSASNAGQMSSNVIGASAAAGGGGAVTGVSAQGSTTAEQPTGATGLMRRLSTATRPADLTVAGGNAMAGAAVNTTTNCDSGSISISGDIAANGTGTVNVAYNNCRTGSDTINGPATLRVDSYDSTNKVITDGTLTMTRVNFSGPGTNIGFTGSIRTQTDTSAQTERFTGNFVTQDNNTQKMTRVDNLVIVNHYDNVLAKTFFTESINGHVCDGTMGCVDVSTQTAPFTDPWGPLYFSTTTQSFPDWGIITLTGTTSTAKITSMGIDLAKVEVDSNGDGTVDNTARLPWSAFNTAIGSDLADNDGDGMHNSWETFYNLNSNSAADKNTDADSDGFSNWVEYLAGSSPATNGSVPSAVRHLWVTGNRDLAFDAASGQIQVFVGGTGSGVLLDPVTRELGAAFSGATEPNGSGNTTTAPDAQGRVFTLTPTAVPTTYTLTSSTGASLTITGVAGSNPGSLIRYGAHGLAFRTVGASGPGYIYLVESTALVP